MGFVDTAVSNAQRAMNDADRLIQSAQRQAQSVISVGQTKVGYNPLNIVFDEPDGPSPFEATLEEPTFDAEVQLRDIVIPETLTLPVAPEPLDVGSLFKA